MENFTLVFSPNAEVVSAVLNQSMQSLGALFKERDGILRFEKHACLDDGIGWVTTTNECLKNHSLINSFVDDAMIVLSFGEVDGSGNGSAKTIRDLWMKGGVDSAMNSEGCFSAAIFDRHLKKLTIIGDIIGQRTLRYSLIENGIIVSTHDICLLSTGMQKFTVDLTSLTSFLSNGWPLQEASLVNGIHVCKPDEVVTFQDSKVKHTNYFFFDRNQKISPHDSGAIEQQNKLILDEMIAFTSNALSRGERPLVELSAGFDSRAVLAISLACTPASNITVLSDSASCSLDVKVAREIASRLGLSFTNEERPLAKPEEISQDIDNLALSTNGIGNVLPVMTNKPINYHSVPPLSLCGDGGEIYRGYYYPYSFLNIGKKIDKNAVIKKIVNDSRIRFLPWKDPSCIGEFKGRLGSLIDHYLCFTDNMHEVLDLFFVFESFGVHKEVLMRTHGALNRTGPFYSRKALRLAFQLPSPLRTFNRIHANAIKNYAPSCYDIPINNKIYLPLKYGNSLERGIMELIELRLKVWKKVQKFMPQKSSVGTGEGDLDFLRSHHFNSFLTNETQHILTEKDSCSVMAFGEDAVKKMIASQLSGNPSNVIHLGNMVAVERFRILCSRIAKEAQESILTRLPH